MDRRDLDAATQSYENAAQVVRGGRSVIVFVEGTRSRDGSLLEFKKGAFVLVGTPIPTNGLTYDDRDALLARARGWFEEQQAGVDAVGSQA